jgi:peptidoglycan/LPS O-acetylase OafA/YrhL
MILLLSAYKISQVKIKRRIIPVNATSRTFDTCVRSRGCAAPAFGEKRLVRLCRICNLCQTTRLGEPLSERFYQPELDVVRLVAFLTVFAHHSASRTPNTVETIASTLVDAAGFGLPLFFVLSAYLITTLLLREKLGTGTIDISKFYKRRMLRIWPLYFGALLIGMLFALVHGHFQLEWRWYVAACFMLGNTNIVGATIFAHLWSISIEEQFYVFWPGLVRKVNTRHLVFAAALLILVANLVLVHYGRIHASSDYPVWFNSFVQFEMFAAGILLAIVTFKQANWLSSWVARSICVGSVVAILFSTEHFFHIKSYGYPSSGPLSLCLGYALVASCCAVFTYALLGSRGWPKWLVHLGRVSYGLYVFHLPVISFLYRELPDVPIWVDRALSLLLTIFLALLSYRYFETPFLKIKQRLEVIPSRPVEVD